MKSVNPSTLKLLGKIDISSSKDILVVVAQAQKAKDNWKEVGLAKRVTYLKKAYEAFWKRRKELAELITQEMGMPVSVRDLIEMNPGFDYFKWYLENAEKYLSPEVTYEDKQVVHKVYYEPTGVAAVIVPWLSFF